MSKYAWLVLALAFCIAPVAYADEASSTPETIQTAPEDTASTTSPAPPPAEEASTTPPVPGPDPVPVPVPDPVSIVLDIEAAGTTLFKGPITVHACAAQAGAQQEVMGYCALEQSGVAAAWSWWGDDAFLDSLGDAANDNAGGVYWMWFANLEMGGVALNKHTLIEGESLLVTLGTMPLCLEIEAHPIVDSTTTISVLAFGFDASYNPVWLPAAGASVHIGSQSFVADTFGQVVYTASTTESLEVYASKDGFVPTSRSTLTSTVPVPAPTGTAQQEGSENGGTTKKRSMGATEALTFLLAQQRADGSFGSVMTSDWAALALAGGGAPREAKVALGDFLASAKKLTSLTDYERRAIALEALGINPYESGIIQKIVAGFDGTQMGDPGLLNDDIFALPPLLHAGYKPNDDMIVKIASHILSSQEADGSWRYQDITSAAIQALAPLSSIEGVPAALKKAAQYLKARQEEDGCFGNVFAHSWALQAIEALREAPEEWQAASGATPRSCLLRMQGEDGGFETGADNNSRIWATAYAIPALLSTKWDELLGYFDAPKQKERPAARDEIIKTGEVLGSSTTATTSAAQETKPVPAVASASLATKAPTAAPPTSITLPPAATSAAQERVLQVKVPRAEAAQPILSRLWTMLWHGLVSLFSAVL